VASAEALLIARWQTLAAAAGLRRSDDLGVALVAAYAEPHRRYHGLAHITFLLDEIDRRECYVADVSLLRLAAWFHDAIYDPLAKDNEERSAAWARRELVLRGTPHSRAEAVAALIVKTKSHHAGEASPDEALFLDMDFAILGADRAIYAAYSDNIHAEYAAIPEPAFRAGRVAFLEGVLAQGRMFRTELYESELAVAARGNIAWEIARLA
jgi:predicted metal-dependent HD superfamily phosphohydrolase